MMLPKSCEEITIRPTSKFYLRQFATTRWSPLITYSLTLTKNSHIIATYQYSGPIGRKQHMLMRFSINNNPQRHSRSIVGNTDFSGNFGLWQGTIGPGTHKLSVDYRNPFQSLNNPNPTSDLTWQSTNRNRIWQGRVLTIIHCS